MPLELVFVGHIHRHWLQTKKTVFFKDFHSVCDSSMQSNIELEMSTTFNL